MRSTLPPVIEDLLKPEAYDHPAGDIELLQTHISYVLLAGPYAYKIKKAVELGFVDYGTLDRRREMCEAEVRLNARLCPEAYIGVVPVTRAHGGHLINGDGEVVEYAVKMRRMPHERMMPHLLEHAAVTRQHVRALARRIAAFHEASHGDARVASFGGVQAVRENWQENFDQTRPYIGRTIEAETYEAIDAYVGSFLRGEAALFDERRLGGRVRDCHGDLRSDSVVIHPDGSICVMDCIEFNDRLRYGDVASDIGFLAMDLEFRGHQPLSDELLATYIDASRDGTLPLVLPFYKCYRAFVRGKVESLQVDEPEVPDDQRKAAADRARRYFTRAGSYATERRPATVLMMLGLSGTGKSYVAHAVAARVGAVVLSSDVARKRAARITQRGRLSEVAYTPAARARVYDELLREARAHLKRGHSVVLDATFMLREHRDAARAVAQRAGVPLLVLHVTAPEEEMRQRLDERAGGDVSASDATWAVYLTQRNRFEPPAELPEGAIIELDGAAPVDESVDAVMARLSGA
jgi:aminoglycoside phosphotransferase family enzyme/predicted kinase